MTKMKVTRIQIKTTYLQQLLLWLQSYWTD
jgi:hypothetical protein